MIETNDEAIQTLKREVRATPTDVALVAELSRMLQRAGKLQAETTLVTFEGRVFQFSSSYMTYKERGSKKSSRCYISDVEATIPAPTEAAFGRPVHTQRGADVELDKAWDKHNRSYVKTTSKIVKGVLNAAGVAFTDCYFSRTAMCGCGCSPGFVVKLAGVELRNMDVSVYKF